MVCTMPLIPPSFLYSVLLLRTASSPQQKCLPTTLSHSCATPIPASEGYGAAPTGWQTVLFWHCQFSNQHKHTLEHICNKDRAHGVMPVQLAFMI